ncbi:unnamed protein product, partial [Meganyctiphanes norvegica]
SGAVRIKNNLVVKKEGFAVNINKSTTRDNLKVCCKCKEGDHSCTDGTCIPQDFVCDGVYDCRDGKDEENCAVLRRAAVDEEPIEEIPTFPLEMGNDDKHEL